MPQTRLMLMGYPGTGKTWSALTFPNPVVLNLDRGLSAHIGKKIIEIPLYDIALIDALAKRSFQTAPPNARDAVKHWLVNEAQKLEADQTLIVDSWTTLQNAFDLQTKLEPVYSTKTGKEDTYAFWARKVEYALEVCSLLKNIRCHVVVTVHETVERNDDGNLTGKIKPLMQGQFADQLGGHFTDVFRQLAVTRYKEPSNTKSEVIGTDYLWQTQSDNVVNCKTCLVGAPKFIKATYEDYIKYKNKTV